jgi:hypothetical protein
MAEDVFRDSVHQHQTPNIVDMTKTTTEVQEGTIYDHEKEEKTKNPKNIDTSPSY